MQNKGFVRVFAIALTLVCIFYLSFSFVTRHYTNKAAEYANGDAKKEQNYLDSLSNKKVYLWAYKLKQCREMEIGLGLDLKGGMQVILEVSIGDVLDQLADHKDDPNFKQAIKKANVDQANSQDDYVTLFIRNYKKLSPNSSLASLFATQKLKDKVNTKSTDAEVESVLRTEIKAAVTNSYNVLRTRIDRFGVVQPRIQTLEDKMGRIMVELPGIKEPERVRRLLQGSANLEFWETYSASAILPYVQQADALAASQIKAQEPAEEVNAEEAKLAEAKDADAQVDSLKSELTGEKADTEVARAQMLKRNPLLARLSLNQSGQGPVVGYASAKDTAMVNSIVAMTQKVFPSDLRLKWGVSPAQGSTNVYELYAIKSTMRNGKAPLEGDVVVDAKDEFDQYSNPAVSMSMNTEGARRWAQLTKKNIGRSIAIVLDNYVYSAPNVNAEITGGNSQITGNFTPEESKDLANVLKSGKMPAPARIVQEDIVGPSLGHASINAGIISFAVALVLLMVYMCVMYGMIPGMIANGALVLNFFFTLGILSSFQAALTMSGIAGMVLTLGMAVDANVLIYERAKEEMRGGKGTKLAIQDGYKNALSAIFDSNLTSIITGVILFNFGTGPIRGFATTLIIGICASFFTAVFMTRLVYEHYLDKGKFTHLTFTSPISKKLLVDTKFNFMGNAKKALMVVVVLIIVSLGFLMTRGLSESIDFTGGRNYKVEFAQQVQPEQVRDLLETTFDADRAAKGITDDASISAIAVGSKGNTVRISTNYNIEDNSAEADTQMESLIYKGVKPLLTEGTTLENFIDREHVGGAIISSQKVGPSIAEDIKVSAIWSVVLSLLAIALYILFRFRNISYSVGSVLALTSDTLMILGVYSICWGWMPFSLEVDQTFIGAILTAIGYSINDKVVIFDRIREFFGLYPKHDKRDIFNDSLNTTLARTISTSISTLIVLLCIFILGGESIQSFAFAMILGVVIGTLSSLFVAAPIAYGVQTMQKPKKVK